MAGLMQLMAGWQMALVVIGLYVLLLVLLILRKRKSRLPTRKHLSRKRQQLKGRFLDTSQPPFWWEWDEENDSSARPVSKDEENAS